MDDTTGPVTVNEYKSLLLLLLLGGAVALAVYIGLHMPREVPPATAKAPPAAVRS